MAFNVQNDTGTTVDANAYLSVADFRTYWTNRNVDTSALTDTTVEGLIVEATQYIDTRFSYYGLRLEGRDQDTQFPRSSLYDSECVLVEGIPVEVKNATAEYAYKGNTTALSSTYSATDQNITKESKKVDVIEKSTEYNGSKISASTWNVYQIADNILTKSGFVVQTWGLGRA